MLQLLGDGRVFQALYAGSQEYSSEGCDLAREVICAFSALRSVWLILGCVGL